jgi:hypothetical protein
VPLDTIKLEVFVNSESTLTSFIYSPISFSNFEETCLLAVSFIEERLRLKLIKGYGLTECAPLVLLDGKPIDCNTVKIDEHHQNELLVSGTNVFDGYINIETKIK